MKDAFERRRLVPQHFLGRVSTERSDLEGIRNHQNLILAGYHIRVFVDGVEHDGVMMADPNAGLVRAIRVVRGSISMIRLTGDVSIRLERSERG
jgi:hypothetical protein